MEPKVGQVSGVLEEREQGIPRGSKRWAGRDYGWQTQESFEKVLSMRNGGAFFDFTRQFIGDPVEQTLGRMQQALTKTGVYQNILKPIIEPAAQVAAENIPPIIQSSAIGQTLEDAEIVTESVREELRQRGQDPRFADTGRMLAEEAVGGVLGKTVGMAGKVVSKLPPTSGGMALATAAPTPIPPSMSVTPSFEKGGLVMKAVTSQHTEALELTGRKTGEEIVGANVEIGKQLTKRKKDIQSVESDIKYYKEALEGLDELKGDPRNLRAFVAEDPDLSRLWNRYVEKYGPDKVFAKVRKKYAEQKADADTMWSRIKSNVLPFEKEGDYSKWYASSAAKPFKQKAEKILRARGELQIKEYLQQHHLIPKGMTAAYFDKMDQLIASGKAKLDDLVLMAEVAAAKGKPTGDVKVNIEDMIPKPHNEMHMVLRSQGAEVAKSKLIKDLSKVNTVDELMEKWVREFDPDGNFTYNYETAKVWEGLDKLLKELRGS